jgi:uncharacterized protein YabN with tetrapyrrole methylase and pyrophosphatase domain
VIEPLRQAHLIQAEAARSGFDWPHIDQVWDKLQEELQELRAESSPDRLRDELGDVIFVLVNLARHLGVDPQQALSDANAKFARRFAYVMAHAEALPPMTAPGRLDAMEALWQAAKQQERR